MYSLTHSLNKKYCFYVGSLQLYTNTLFDVRRDVK